MWFLLIPPVAVLVTLVWFALRSRPERRPEALITVEGYRRSMAALARPLHSSHDPSSRDRSWASRAGGRPPDPRSPDAP
ncbi:MULTISPECIES: hypothetical protein [unclassified Frankia]|uniref:hypothetical protein n=1 Tax=unclassified Frankia TaxID=2632575 RepID=UPI0020257466